MVIEHCGSSGVPTHRYPVSGRVFVTEFSPFEWSSNLLAAGFASSILIAQIKFQEEDDKISGFDCEVLKEIHHETRVQSLAWCPKTSLVVAPKLIEFATSGTDHKLRLFTSDVTDVNMRVLKGHSDYINSIVYEPETGDQVVTGSDDHTAKLWDTADSVCVHTFYFKSPVMSVSWHQAEPGKLLIAQKCGVISIFNVSSFAAIMSLDCGGSPLLSTDWCLNNSLMLCAAVSTDAVVFDLSRPSIPSDRRSLHSEGCRVVKFSRQSDNLLASSGRPGYGLRIGHSKNSQSLVNTSQKVVGGMSWHCRLPYLAVGNDREISMYKISFSS